MCFFFFVTFKIQVRYLDFLDFGTQNVDQTTPRVLVWKGSMIKVYSELDCKGRHQFGKKRLKEEFAGYRLQVICPCVCFLVCFISPFFSQIFD